MHTSQVRTQDTHRHRQGRVSCFVCMCLCMVFVSRQWECAVLWGLCSPVAVPSHPHTTAPPDQHQHHDHRHRHRHRLRDVPVARPVEGAQEERQTAHPTHLPCKPHPTRAGKVIHGLTDGSVCVVWCVCQVSLLVGQYMWVHGGWNGQELDDSVLLDLAPNPRHHTATTHAQGQSHTDW